MIVVFKKNTLIKTVCVLSVLALIAVTLFENSKTAESARINEPDKKMVALTFDDGPHAVYTNQILDVLEQYGAVATFFEVGENLYKAPDALNRALEMGCELGSHTYSHINLATATEREIKEELEKTNALFEEVTGRIPTLLRPPYGESGKLLCSISDQYLIGWSVDTLDWKYRNTDKIINTVKKEDDLDGDVILMHSIYKTTADAVEILVPWLIQNGYQLVTVSELMQYRLKGSLQKGFYYGYTTFK